ncbi:TetR/AcrR family transcriptional regulator [Salinarchaeum sp. IM2453]|uniref:TetR/AcrR family transcriptional regulator n=1 Tax=Salinarchaeum sp. IM2453 TaxID=2862870 RepID=UPI001C83D722|nr:TetR/AcrR family transcriptional regulator [Salinarchaeum sp. IM2453]QZA89146.1 TetR/AcrR family transcriptional regulator [Salinarchaeum sp. IM2453]
MADEGEQPEDVNALFFDDPEDTQRKLLAATYRALCEHGYADLSLQTIGDEFGKSTSLIYYHYDSKDELVLDTLDAMLDQLEETLSDHPDDPEAALEVYLDMIEPGKTEEPTLERAIVELRGQAPNSEQYQKRFNRADAVIDQRLKQVVQAGIEQGVFVDQDPEETGRVLYTLLTGVMVRRASTNNDEWVTSISNEVRNRLYGDKSQDS